jgi:CHAT domain-containing protein/Tfp pilus assembly protein PilF
MPLSKQTSTTLPFRRPAIIALLLVVGWLGHFNARNSASAAPQPEATPLELGKPIGRELKGGETHLYRVKAEAAQFFHVIVEQRGADVAVTLVGPDGGKLFEIDSPNGAEGPEPVLWVAETAGNYRIEVRTSDEQAKAARYEARLETLRASTDADRNRVAATRASAEAEHLFDGDAAAKRRALAKYTEALELWRKLEDQHGIAEALTGIGDLHRQLQDYSQATTTYQEVLARWRALKDQDHEAQVLHNLGMVYYAAGDRQKAIEHYNQALPLRRALKDVDGQARTLNSLATIYFNQGEKRKALGYYNQALKLRRENNDRGGAAQTLSSIGAVYSDLGEPQKAIDAYVQALPFRRTPAERAITLNNMGRAYDTLGVPQEALNYYNQSLQLVRSAGEKRGEAQTLNFIGLSQWAQGDYQQALNNFEAALKLRREVKDKNGEAATLNNLGLVYIALDDQQRALEVYNQAVPLFRETGNRQGEAYALNNLGFLYEKLGDSSKALDYHQQALKLSQTVGDRMREAKVRYGIARVESQRDRLKPARAQIEQGVKIVESLRQKLASPELRAAYRASLQQYYDLYIDVLMRLGKRAPRNLRSGLVAEALQVSERARARSLLELLTEAGADIRQGIAPELIERERELQEQLNEKTSEQIRLLNTQAKPAQIAALNQEIAQLNSALRETQNQIRTSSPRYAALTQPQPLTTAAIQRQLLTPDTLLLEYALGAERSYLWVVSRTALRSYTLPKRETIETAARRYYELLTARNQFVANETRQARETRIAQAEAELAEAAAELSRLLLGPVTPLLRKQRLLVVSDGALQYVPFGALPLRGRSERESKSPTSPLLARHEITTLPSASTLAVLRRETANRQPAQKALAVFADPVFESQDERVKKVEVKADKKAEAAPTDTSRILLVKAAKETGVTNVEFHVPRLPYTRREAEAILALTPSSTSRAAFDFAATRTAALNEELGQYRIIHFATHGFLNSLNPELSGIVLALVNEQGAPQQGYLLAPEVYNLKLNAAELVVLSACQTGLGKEVAGEGVVGLTRGFMYAGAPRVVVSLWSVNDRATADLMKTFYQGMLAQGMRPAAALRAAQLALWKQKEWQAPYYWAAFTLQGEWR